MINFRDTGLFPKLIFFSPSAFACQKYFYCAIRFDAYIWPLKLSIVI